MSRTFLIERTHADPTAIIVNPVHSMADAAERARKGSDIAFNPKPTAGPFTFDVLDRVKGITSETMRTALLSSMAFSADGFIAAKLAGLLSTFYKAPQDANEKPWATYQAFLQHANTLAHEKRLLDDMGLDVEDVFDTLRQLYAIRMECHRMMADGKTSYETPSLEAFIGNPKLRGIDAQTHIKWEGLVDDEVSDTAFTSDVQRNEFRSDMLAAFKERDKGERLQSLDFDKDRAKTLCLMLQAFKLTDMEHSVEDPEAEPFMHLPALAQYKFLNSALKSLNGFMQRAAKDNRITPSEYAKFRMERKPYAKELEAAMTHEHFDEVEVN